MATFTWTSSQQSLTESAAALIVPFGDGYEQRTVDGLAPAGDRYSLTFKRPADIPAIEAFLIAHAGVDRFTWTPYGPGQVPGYFVSKEWAVSRAPGVPPVLTALFERVYI